METEEIIGDRVGSLASFLIGLLEIPCGWGLLPIAAKILSTLSALIPSRHPPPLPCVLLSWRAVASVDGGEESDGESHLSGDGFVVRFDPGNWTSSPCYCLLIHLLYCYRSWDWPHILLIKYRMAMSYRILGIANMLCLCSILNFVPYRNYSHKLCIGEDGF